MDTSRDTIVVGILRPGEEIPAVDRIFNDEASVRRLVGRFGDRLLLSACYEARVDEPLHMRSEPHHDGDVRSSAT